MNVNLGFRRALRRAVAAVAATVALLAGAGAHAQTVTGSDLNYFRNYFVTGNYAAGYVGLAGKGVNGLATGAITIAEGTAPGQVPQGAEILAAYLYWQTVAESGGLDRAKLDATFGGATFRGKPIVGQTVVLNPKSGTAPCWSSGGGTGSANGSKATYTFRADVLRYLPTQTTTTPYRILAAGTHPVVLPDSGGTGAIPNALGAALVIVWRQPGIVNGQPRQPLRSIVIFDGGSSLNNAKTFFQLPLTGFYQATGTDSTGTFQPGKNALLTQFLGNGQAKFSELVQFSGTGSFADKTSPFYQSWTNPFASDAGANMLQAQVALPTDAALAALYVDSGGQSSSDCLNWGVVALSSEVKDTDGDGLVDVWETNTGTLRDPAGNPLPPLWNMGANPNVPDLFVEVNWTGSADAARPYGVHNHRPSRLALNNVATVFRNAAPRAFPRACNPGVAGDCAINVHFDVGNTYQCGDRDGNGQCDAAPRGGTAPTLPTADQCRASWTVDCSIVPWKDAAGNVMARGGNQFGEQPSATFPDVPGGVTGWKTGFRVLRDQLVVKGTNTKCTNLATQTCEPLFQRARKDMFRYALFGHWIGIPSLSSPTRPASTSGVADSGGADLMVTLGGWANSNLPFIEAATFAHELGHTLGLRHGGVTERSLTGGAAGVPTPEPNCKPNYQSVMSYLFQVRGLRDPRQGGLPVIDFSRRRLNGLNEPSLAESANPLGGPDYLPSWYAQSGVAVDRALRTTPVQRKCDGSFDADGNFRRVDVDARGWTAANPIDWNVDGVIASSAGDVNYDGSISNLGEGANDFETMDFRQIGARRAVGSPSVGGGLSLDAGYADLGYADLGYADLGYADLGYADLGYADLGYADLGYADLGYADLGQGDNGFGDAHQPLFETDPVTGQRKRNPKAGDIDLEVGGTQGQTPSTLSAQILKKTVQVSWVAPVVGQPLSYTVYRIVGSQVTEAAINAATTVRTVLTGSPPFTSFVDSSGTKGVIYTYFVVAKVRVANPDPATQATTPTIDIDSSPSNYATVTFP
jgi:uncharacterized protein YjbI with pentapeptide repeats